MTIKQDDKKVAVTVRGVASDGWLLLQVDPAGACIRFNPVLAEPLPPSLTPEAQAVLEWAVSRWSNELDKHTPAAILAYLATLTPPDPQAALEAAARAVVEYGSGPSSLEFVRTLRSALAALDESRKP